MSENATQVRKLLRQQAAVAQFGSFALRESDVPKILTEAARVCAECMSVPFSKVCRYRERENDLLIEAGYGWHAGVIGDVVSPADVTSPQGRAFVTGQPSICNDLRDETEPAAADQNRRHDRRDGGDDIARLVAAEAGPP